MDNDNDKGKNNLASFNKSKIYRVVDEWSRWT